MPRDKEQEYEMLPTKQNDSSLFTSLPVFFTRDKLARMGGLQKPIRKVEKFTVGPEHQRYYIMKKNQYKINMKSPAYLPQKQTLGLRPGEAEIE